MSNDRKASVQSRHGSLPNSISRARVSANAGGPGSTAMSHYDTPKVIKPMSRESSYPHHVAHHRALPSPPGRWLSFEFKVEDTGPGIPQHLHNKIFEPFVQGDLGLNRKYGGTGLGLSICSQLVGLMKGTMGMKSEVGQGSVFVMSIPLKLVASRSDSTASSSIHLARMTSPSQSELIDETRVPSLT